MFKISHLLFLLAVLPLFLTNCAGCAKDLGVITLINATDSDATLKLDGEEVMLKFGTLATHAGQRAGRHILISERGRPIQINVSKDRTTVYDINGDNCYVVADFTEQYKTSGSGVVNIVERFDREKLFTTKGRMIANLGEELPDYIGESANALRIHRVHCADLNNDAAIIESISSTP